MHKSKEENKWLKLSLADKEMESLKIIKKQFKKYDKPVVACSWGKDSITVLHLLYRASKEIEKDFDVLWNNTLIHYPSVYEIKNKLKQKWNLNIIETKANKTFWDIVDEYGWPGLKSSDRSDKANSACCYHIKKKPTKDAVKDNDWDVYFDGLTAYESNRRYLNIKDYGLEHYHKGFNVQKVHPIAWWRTNDVWNYIEKHDLVYPDLYDKEVEGWTKRGVEVENQGHRVDRQAIRNGCWPCTLGLKIGALKMKQLRKYYPKLWEALMKEKGLADKIAEKKLGGQGTLTDGYYTEETRDDWLEQRPCFFDKI